MKDIGRSMAAKRQPRTPDGRFASVKTYVVMDEWGNVSPYEPKEETFGYTTAVTRNPRKMGKLAQWYRATNGTDKEVKASDKLWGRRIQMAVKIRSTDIKSKAYYVDKRRPPIGWGDADNEKVLSKRKRSNERNKIREQLLEEIGRAHV